MGAPKLNRNRAGQTSSNAPGPSARLAAVKRVAGNGTGARSDGNARSVKRPAAPLSNAKARKPPGPAGEKPDRTQKQVEGTPPFAKQSLSGDGWTRASERAREMFAARK